MQEYIYSTKRSGKKQFEYKYTVKLLTTDQDGISIKVIREGYSQTRESAKIRALIWIKRYKQQRNQNV